MIGPGPTFECVQFITTSQSPLFQHHLYMKRLKENEANPYTVLVMGRTQIKQKPYPPHVQSLQTSLHNTVHLILTAIATISSHSVIP